MPGIQIFGFASAAIVAFGYLPQIVHLAKEGCSAGVSIRAWCLWLLATLLVFVYGLAILDVVLITLQSVQLVAILSIITLARKYRTTCKRCADRELKQQGERR